MAKFREYLYILTTFVWDEKHLVTHLHLCITVYGHKPPLLLYACLHAPLTSLYECLHEHKFIIIKETVLGAWGQGSLDPVALAASRAIDYKRKKELKEKNLRLRMSHSRVLQVVDSRAKWRAKALARNVVSSSLQRQLLRTQNPSLFPHSARET